jgi:hypothetical protein
LAGPQKPFGATSGFSYQAPVASDAVKALAHLEMPEMLPARALRGTFHAVTQFDDDGLPGRKPVGSTRLGQ